jgi:pterin-4a-carbinolamine dehydratase
VQQIRHNIADRVLAHASEFDLGCCETKAADTLNHGPEWMIAWHFVVTSTCQEEEFSILSRSDVFSR